MIIYLVRHGDKIRKSGDVSLSDLGKEQARKTGEYLKDKHIDLILFSPQKRAKLTAGIIKKILKTPLLKIDELLRERVNFGDVPSQGYMEFMEMVEKSSVNRNYILPNGETSINTGKRMELVIKHIALDKFKNVAIITHGGIITDYLRNVFSESILNSIYANFSIKRENAIGNCSITKLEVINNRVRVLEIGSVSHLI